MGIAMNMYADEYDDYLTWNPWAGISGWTYYTYIVQAYNAVPPTPYIWNAGWWVYTGHLPGELLHCPGQTYVNPACYMAPGTLSYRVVDNWEKENPTNPDTGARHTEWLYITYAFNSGLTASTWYSTKPWTRATGYTEPMDAWRLNALKPEWPVIADLRSYTDIGNGHPGPYNSSHRCAGFNVMYADSSVNWVKKPLPWDLSDIGNQAYDSWTYNGASLSRLWDNDFLE